MKQDFLKKNGSDSLLLFFGGWGSAPVLFRDSVALSGRDCLFCYDYKDCSFDFALLDDYKDIVVLAWSMGVWTASRVLGDAAVLDGRISEAVAIGGTPWPIDDSKGIPQSVFDATLDRMSPVVLYKFRRRMCGADLPVFESRMPDRTIEDLKDELSALKRMSAQANGLVFTWTMAHVCRGDLIFPAANQMRAWEEAGVPVEMHEGAHYDSGLFDRLCAAL
ncbi:MAG: alpha/beta fold hydrolase [Candidatus Cryptobacteroides sp.]